MTGPCGFPETVLGPADLETIKSEARVGAKEAGAGRVQSSGLGKASGSKEGPMCRMHLNSQGLKGHQGRSGDFIPRFTAICSCSRDPCDGFALLPKADQKQNFYWTWTPLSPRERKDAMDEDSFDVYYFCDFGQDI